MSQTPNDPQMAGDAPWLVTARRPQVGAEALLPRSYRLIRRARQTHDTFTLELHAHGEALPTAAPGQFYMLYAFEVGEVPISLSHARDNGHLLFTIRDVGAVTRALTRLRKGEPVGVRGPFGTSWPLSEAEGGDVLLMAGGLGLAPLRPALEQILVQRERYRKVALLCGARTPDDLIFRTELPRWARRAELQVGLTVDAAESGWEHDVGVVTDLLESVDLDFSQTTALVCGPPVMMRFSARSLTRLGTPADRIHLSMERNMRCALGFCGHCQLGPFFICRDGPVLSLPRLAHWFSQREM